MNKLSKKFRASFTTPKKSGYAIANPTYPLKDAKFHEDYTSVVGQSSNKSILIALDIEYNTATRKDASVANVGLEDLVLRSQWHLSKRTEKSR